MMMLSDPELEDEEFWEAKEFLFTSRHSLKELNVLRAENDEVILGRVTDV
jgi:hypothetical protein